MLFSVSKYGFSGVLSIHSGVFNLGSFLTVIGSGQRTYLGC